MPNYPQSNCCPLHALPTASGSSKILDDLTSKLIDAIFNKKDTLPIEGNLIATEGLDLLKALKQGYGITAGWNTPDTLMLQMMEMNLFEFSASKVEARLAAMTDLLIDKDKKEIRSFPEFEKLASETGAKFNREWLQAEYNLSVAVGQNSASYHRFMAQKDDFPFVEYQTAGDSKVRSQHAKLEGKIFNLNDREAMALWPPNGYGCRCEMLQTNKRPKNVTTGEEALGIMHEADPKWEGSQFEINRADLKQVFTNKQFYSDIKGLPKKLKELSYDKYDLKAYDAFKQDLNTLPLDSSITDKNVKELFVTSGKIGPKNFMGFKDYLDRKMVLTEATFDRHTTGKYLSETEYRHQLFPHVKDVLLKPDEVWLMKEGIEKTQYLKYVKYYNNTSIVVVNQVQNNRVELKTWYPMKDESGTRAGILIKRKKD